MLHITTFVFSLSSPSKWNHAVCVGCSRAREFHQHVAKRDDKLWFSCSHHRNMKSSPLLRTTFLRLVTGASSHLPPVGGSRLDVLRTGCCGIRNSLFPRLEGVREEERESPLPRAHLPGNIWTVSPLQHWAEQPSNLFSAIGQRKKGKRKKKHQIFSSKFYIHFHWQLEKKRRGWCKTCFLWCEYILSILESQTKLYL